MLGSEELVTIDISDFEGANYLHDLNEPIPPELNERFDAVCDFGTLEHIFNFPVAMRNCLEMVKLSGHFFSQAPANNYFGHGFYQFGPDLFFGVLSEQNGFRLDRITVVEYGPRRRRFEVTDLQAVKTRATLVNSFPVMIQVQAMRTAIVPVLREYPRQFDFVRMWAGRSTPPKTHEPDRQPGERVESLKRWLLESYPRVGRLLESFRYSSLNRAFSFRNRRSFGRRKKRP
jgi:hypothetical protein